MLKELRYMLLTFLKCVIVIGIIVLAITLYMQFIKRDPKIISNKKVILNVQKKVDAYLKVHGYDGFTKTKANTTIYSIIPSLKGIKYKSGNKLIDPDCTELPEYNVAEDASYICAIKMLDDPATQYVNESDYCIYIKNPKYIMNIVDDKSKNYSRTIEMNTSFFSIPCVDDTVQIGIDGYVKNQDVLTGKFVKYGLIKKEGEIK